MILNNILLSILMMFSGSNADANAKAEAELNLSNQAHYQKAEVMYDNHVQELYNEIGLQNYDLDFSIFEKAVTGYFNLKEDGKLDETKNLISIIDYTKPSSEKRFYTIDLEKKEVLYHTHVAHGMQSGTVNSTDFSNEVNSNKSSIGFLITGETYYGIRGYSLRLDGQDPEYNTNVRERAVVIHKSDKVNETWATQNGMVGRSLGCPAVPTELHEEIINTIKGKTMLFNYYDDSDYLASTEFLNEFDAVAEFIQTA
jgi:hypothetical protein